MTLIKIIAHSSSKSSSIKIGEVLDVYVKEPADKDKANIAIIKLLSKHFGKKVRIKAGLKSKHKTIVFDE